MAFVAALSCRRLESVIRTTASCSAQRRAPAEKNVKEFLKHPEAAMQLLYVAASGMGSADVRQLAAIMLRKRMSGYGCRYFLSQSPPG